MKLTAPQRGVLASFAFLLISMLSAQALAFDAGGFSYTVIGTTTDVEVTGRAGGNTATDIVIPSTVSDGPTDYSVISIGVGAFNGSGLTSVVIPDSVTIIGDSAFLANLVLYDVTIPDSVTTIGEFAFGLNSLTSVIIPSGVTTIGDRAFACQASLGSGVTVDEIGSEFLSCRFDQIGSGNQLTSAVFLGAYPADGTFNLTMFGRNASLTTITYCQGAAGWENPTVAFDIGLISDSAPILVTTTSTVCASSPATPVPTSPLWLLGIMAGVLSLVAVKKLHKT